MFRTLVSLTVLCVLVAAATPRSYGQKPQASPKDEEAKLINLLKSDAPRKATGNACRELARIGTRRSVAPLAALLCNPEPAQGIGPLRSGADSRPGRGYRVARHPGKSQGTALGRRHRQHRRAPRDPKAVVALVKRLDDPDPEVVQASARALGRIGTLDAVAPLEKALSSTAQADRIAVSEGLLRCADVLRAAGQRQGGGGDLRATSHRRGARVCPVRRHESRRRHPAKGKVTDTAPQFSGGQDPSPGRLQSTAVGAAITISTQAASVSGARTRSPSPRRGSMC